MKNNDSLYKEIEGSGRERTHVLAKVEDKLIEALCPRVPGFIETYHLTLSALISSGLILLFGFLSHNESYWLLGVSSMLVVHYFTDILDGEVGRRRNTGLVRWGFYTDHFLDLLFGSTLLVSYALFLPELVFLSFCLFIVLALFFLDSALFGLVGPAYTTSGFLGLVNPTEITLFFVLLNIFLIFLSSGVIVLLFKIIVFISIISLGIHFYRRSRQLWDFDMQEKDKDQ